MKNKLIALSGFGLTLAPLIASAQAGTCADAQNQVSGTFSYIICKIADILNLLIPIVMVLGVLYFVWGVVQYVISDDEEAKATGKMRMIWGIIGLVVIVAMWGLVGIVQKTFGLTGTAQINYPNIPY